MRTLRHRKIKQRAYVSQWGSDGTLTVWFQTTLLTTTERSLSGQKQTHSLLHDLAVKGKVQPVGLSLWIKFGTVSLICLPTVYVYFQARDSQTWWIYKLVPLVAQMVKNLPAMQETQVRFLGWEDPLEKEITTHSNILAWRIPWREEPGRLQSMGLQRTRHDWATNTCTFVSTFTLHWLH